MKRLKAATIVPENLYVERSADRQLREIILNLGRPGYVLVARQMGKTNLLLHAKLTLENIRNIFVYVDLSRMFASERECFRYIVDTALASPHFEALRGQIEKARGDLTVAAYREHERELLLLLERCDERLVIILDEIDYLTNADFSDRIFAQIRSIYFNRVSYAAFNKLTYVLSGVAEPTQLIRDKKVSPFNIGQKIFLDDFNRTEFDSFVAQAELSRLEVTARNKIFHWTQGNPRMTWDVCEEVENRLLAGVAIDAEEVDAVVDSLYLQRFDRPPVDHIRQLIEDDREIRDAITVIRYGKGSTLPDDLRSRLYLAGIISSPAATSAVQIKNPIIDAAVSQQWLRDLDVKHHGLLKSAFSRYEIGDHIGALDLYQKFLGVSEFPPELKATYYGIMASCAYSSIQPALALTLLDKANTEKSGSKDLINNHRILRGTCLIDLGKCGEAIPLFEQALKESPPPADYFDASLFLCAARLEVSSRYDYGAIRSILSELIARLDAQSDSTLTSAERARFYSTAFIDMARNEALGPSDPAAISSYLKSAIRHSPEAQQATIQMLHCQFALEPAVIESAMKSACRLIISGKSPVRMKGAGPAVGPQIRDAMELLFECRLRKLDEEFKQLSTHLISILGETEVKSPKVGFAMAMYAFRTKRHEAGEMVLRELLAGSFGTPVEKLYKLESYRLILLRQSNPAATPDFTDYVSILEGDDSVQLTVVDLRVFLHVAYMSLQRQDYSTTLAWIEWVKKHDTRIPEELKPNLAVFAFYRAFALSNSGAPAAAITEAARAIIAFQESKTISGEGTALLAERDLQTAQQFARSLLSKYGGAPAIRRPNQKLGRNALVTVQYKDGRILKGVKAKRVQDDLTLGLCKLI